MSPIQPWREEREIEKTKTNGQDCLLEFRHDVTPFVSPPFHPRPVVSQEYDLYVNKEYVIRGNSALLKCQYPSFMADHLQVESWLMDDGTVVTQSDHYGTPWLVVSCFFLCKFPPSPHPEPQKTSPAKDPAASC